MNSLAMNDAAFSRASDEARGAAVQPHAAGPLRLSALHVGARGIVLGVGTPGAALSPLDRRLLELGFVSGEAVEVLSEARPGRDPFVVRVGNLTLALRRREAESIWVSGATGES